MRAWWVVSVWLACAGCGGGIDVLGRVSVRAQLRADARAEVEAPVALQGAAVVEFFGLPLSGAQDVVFVLDGSGSMNEPAQGRIAQLAPTQPTATASQPAAQPTAQPVAASSVRTKMSVADDELLDALSKLPEGTRLNVVFFNETIDAFAPGIVAIEGPARDQLAMFVKRTAPNGGTALAPALRAAFLMNPRRIVLLSDGLGNIGGDAESVLRDAREAIRGGVRIDTVGIGGNQDAELMRSLAAESGGLYQSL